MVSKLQDIFSDSKYATFFFFIKTVIKQRSGEREEKNNAKKSNAFYKTWRF